MFGPSLFCALLLIQVSAVFGSNNGSCVECKIKFNEERTAAISDNEKCQVLMNYITCRTNTSTSWPGCALTDDDGDHIRMYYYSISSGCEVSDTCQCQLTRWQNTYDYQKAKTYKTYMSCLYDATMRACDGTTDPSTLVHIAQTFMSDYLKTKDSCDSDYKERLGWNYEDKCKTVKRYISCLNDVPLNGEGRTLNLTEIEDLQKTLEEAEYCELSMSDTCQCQTNFIKSTQSVCEASETYAACANNTVMYGCNREYADDVKAVAKMLKRQNCPNDPAYVCDGIEQCSLDMSIFALQTNDNEERMTYCRSLDDYIACLRSNAPPECVAVNATVRYLKGRTRYGWKCTGPGSSDYNQYTTPMYYYYPTAYPMAYSTAYPIAYSTAYPFAYPTAYPTTSYPTGNSTPVTSPPLVTSLSGDKLVLLMSNIQSAKLEAEENLHAAEEALGAINTAQELMQN